MARKKNPHAAEPQISRHALGCELVFILVTIVIALLVIFLIPKAWLLLILCIPGILFAIYLLFMGGNFLLAVNAFKRSRKLGIIIYSNSPNWQDYIEKNWFPRFGDKFEILNWSERKRWRKLSLASNIFDFFSETTDYNPAVLIFRGYKHPAIYRFYPSFRDAKHGNFDSLTKLEMMLFNELGIDYDSQHFDTEHQQLIRKKKT